MESWLSGLSQHGYSILFAAVFLEAVGMPVPAALALLIAGAAAARGSLQPGLTAATALSALMAGDTIMFLLGHYTGWWLLSLLCRLSLNPESCILRSADSFYKRGRMLLVVAKFVPGINTMAPPMAGSMNMRLLQFLRLDLSGAVLYAGAYFALGWIFSGALGVVTRGYRMFGRALGWVAMAGLAVYVAFVIRAWIEARALRSVPFASPADVARAMSSDSAIIYDVRSHGLRPQGNPDRRVQEIGTECASLIRRTDSGGHAGLSVLHVHSRSDQRPSGAHAAGKRRAYYGDPGRPASVEKGRAAAGVRASP